MKDDNGLYHNMEGVVSLNEMADITPGYYPLHSKIAILKHCHRSGEGCICGYSAALNESVDVEIDAVCPVLSPMSIDDFIDTDFAEIKTYIIVADFRAADFKQHYPLTAQYLRKCFLKEDIQPAFPFVREILRIEASKEKVLISTRYNICHAMIDMRANVISSLGTYALHFPRFSHHWYKSFAAIINSKLFSYCFYNNCAEAKKQDIGRMEVLSRMLMPHPENLKEYMILEDLADCLFYLSRPKIPQIAYDISNERLRYYITNIMDMLIYEMYYPTYMKVRNLDVLQCLLTAPFAQNIPDKSDRVYETYMWYQHPSNQLRQKIDLLDTRSPELLYKIHTFNPNEQD